ncbi:putative integral membrane protein [Theileria parva strain Muguga]|uniref:ZP domain-containing protein n=1 Tax=Theileria parva TaxID=5875 RepID=Q4N7Z1_THEPA|nr:putative integral membrane protein [Theileria parva strain Muguga]EAN33917.1 putative integral membrane protein [Theileria parva strain Muguga]|eukprot:XP_766200.1 hypothetical protein [Theileria parva strain Muguga]
MSFKCITFLLLFIPHTFVTNRRIFRDFKLKQKEYSIIAPSRSVQGQDFNVICQSAKCGYKSNTIYNVVNPECGNYYTCQECPPSFGTDICYLGITNSDWINVTEGHMTLSKHDRVFDHQPKPTKPNTKNTYDYDEDEDSFLQIDTNWEAYGMSLVDKIITSQTFKYVDHHDDKWLMENKRQCQIDPEGNLELSIRLMFQYYKSPLITDNNEQQEELSTLQLRSHTYTDNSGDSVDSNPVNSNKSVNSDNSVNQGDNVVLLEKGEDYYDEDEVENNDNFFSHMAKKGLKYSVNTGKAFKDKLSGAFRFLYQKAQVIMAKPEVHIHFVVDDIRLKSCRQPLSWNGDMTSGAMIFVGNQNFKISHTVLNADFLKKGIRVNTSVKGVYELSFNSCIQIHCTKRQRQFGHYPTHGFNLSHNLSHLLNINPINSVGSVNGVNPVNSVSTVSPVNPVNPVNPVVPMGMNVSKPVIQPPSQPVTNIPSFNTNQVTSAAVNTSNPSNPVNTVNQVVNEGDEKRKKLWLYGSIGVVILLAAVSVPIILKLISH